MNKGISNNDNIIQFPNSKKDKDSFEKIENILDKAQPVKKKKNKLTKPNMSIEGDKNTQIAGDNFVMISYQAPIKETIKKTFTPGPEHITAKQAKKIKDVIDNLVKKETAHGGNVGKSYAKWWGTIKNHFNVTTYKEIPAHLGEEAISWLKQQSAIKRTKIRRNNNTMWRNELYKAIWARSRNLKLSKGEVYYIVNERLGKRITSLKQLGEQNLKKLHSIIMSMKQ